MDYRPRYAQPFTLEEARQLAVPLITEEISRLQNSLAHLRRTQDALKDALAEEPGDPDLAQAFGENEGVIGSQNERVGMLRTVLAEKGIVAGAHYDLAPPPPRPTPPPARPVRQNRSNGLEDDEDEGAPPADAASNGRSRVEGNGTDGGQDDGEDGGVYL